MAGKVGKEVNFTRFVACVVLSPHASAGGLADKGSQQLDVGDPFARRPTCGTYPRMGGFL